MAEQAEETSVRLLDVLIRFVDFLYAALFVAIVRESYEWVILGSVPTVYERTYRLALIAAVFYFFARDWLHGRILTIRNPFTRYRRFFTEVAIAVAGYGAAVGAARGEVTFVFYVAFMLAMRAVWAWGTIREHPGSSDRREISVLRDFQLLVGLLVAVTGFLWHLLGDEMVTMGLAVLFIVGGW
ncbi:MAG: hypothetical protein Q8R38_02830, partial [Candidatus Omnitrophota bacterium]|nr:hypothetical protein [Candidatus Omnitrophota bacterium]